MRSLRLAILTLAAFCAGASSCGSRDETRLAFPPAADLRPVAEPPYPDAALQPGEAGRLAEEAWWNEMLIWGRGEQAARIRVCAWVLKLGYDAPKDFCRPR